jgi:hypothetical protein
MTADDVAWDDSAALVCKWGVPPRHSIAAYLTENSDHRFPQRWLGASRAGAIARDDLGQIVSISGQPPSMPPAVVEGEAKADAEQEEGVAEAAAALCEFTAERAAAEAEAAAALVGLREVRAACAAPAAPHQRCPAVACCWAITCCAALRCACTCSFDSAALLLLLLPLPLPPLPPLPLRCCCTTAVCCRRRPISSVAVVRVLTQRC